MRLALLLPLACSVSAIVAPQPRDGRARRAASVHCSAEAATVAIITGGSGGIGLATAHRLAAKGFDCVLAYGSNDEQAASARSELEAAHGEPGKYTEGLMMREWSACDEDEDVVTMALTAVRRLVERCGVRWEDIGMLQVGSALRAMTVCIHCVVSVH